MSLPDQKLIDLLEDDFVVGWSNIEKEEFVGLSHGYSKKQTAVGTTNGAGGRNVQMIVMAADQTVLHVMPGFWHPDDLERELLFALQLHRLYIEDGITAAARDRMAAVMRESHVRGYSDLTIARSDWQGFDRNEEMQRYRKEPRDTVVLDKTGMPTLKPVCMLIHDRMASRTFRKLEDFDLAEFVDYGRPFYDNNAWIDEGHEFPAAKRANIKRAREEEKERRRLERHSK